MNRWLKKMGYRFVLRKFAYPSRVRAGGKLALVAVVAACAGSLWWYFHPAFERIDGIVYTQRHGHDLTFDVVRAGKKHGWLTMFWDIRTFADWFDRHLQPQRR